MGKNKYKVIVSDRARQMLTGHIRFLAQKSPTAARNVKSEIIDLIRSLSTMPKRSLFLHANFIPFNKYHKLLVAKWYLVLYQVKDQTVCVDYIIDCRQDYQWLIQ